MFQRLFLSCQNLHGHNITLPKPTLSQKLLSILKSVGGGGGGPPFCWTADPQSFSRNDQLVLEPEPFPLKVPEVVDPSEFRTPCSAVKPGFSPHRMFFLDPPPYRQLFLRKSHAVDRILKQELKPQTVHKITEVHEGFCFHSFTLQASPRIPVPGCWSLARHCGLFSSPSQDRQPHSC